MANEHNAHKKSYQMILPRTNIIVDLNLDNGFTARATKWGQL